MKKYVFGFLEDVIATPLKKKQIALAVFAIIAVAAIVIFFPLLLENYDDTRIEITNQTNLLLNPDDMRNSSNKVLRVLNQEDKLTMIGTRYSKEFLFYKVRLTDGTVGYVQYGPGVAVSKKGGND